MESKIKIEGLDCANCALELEEEISKINGVKEVNVSFVNQLVSVSYDSKETLQKIKWLTIKGAITIPIEFIEPPIICLCNAVVFPTEETDKYKLRTTCNTAAEIPITKEPIKKVKKPNGIPVPIIFNLIGI